MEQRKQNILQALRTFARQRPGLEFGNYGDVSAYRSELRGITKNLQHAEVMLANIAWRDSITADCLLSAANGAFSGRLSIVESDAGKVSIDYCTGQYWPTEYRRAVCAVLSSALWDYWRTNGASTGDAIRKIARDELGLGIASIWFN